MRDTLTISLPVKTKRLLERAASEGGLTTSEDVRLTIFRKLWQDAAADSRRVSFRKPGLEGCTLMRTCSA